MNAVVEHGSLGDSADEDVFLNRLPGSALLLRGPPAGRRTSDVAVRRSSRSVAVSESDPILAPLEVAVAFRTKARRFGL
jgi:hypothetical protein